MKKLLLVIFCVTLFGVASAQGIFRPVPADLFTREITADRAVGINDAFLWRFSALLTATELQWDVASKGFISLPLSSVGPAVGYRHYIPLADGSPYNNWGLNLALLMGVDINQVEPANLKVALSADLFRISVGVAYTFNATNHYGILLGTNIVF